MTGIPVNRTMLIGLGGQGQHTLAAAKKRILEAYGEVPPTVKFLALDAAEFDSADISCLAADEFRTISFKEVGRYVEQHHDALSKWMDVDRISPTTLESCEMGSGQIPQVGRLLLQFHLKNILELIESKLSETMSVEVVRDARWNVSGATPQILFFSSIAGGTGAGALLDLACALRTQTPTLGHWNHQAFLMLPGVFRNFPLTPFVEENGYAFLKQLDFFTSERDAIKDRAYGDLFDVRTNDGVEYQMKDPFDRVTLIGNVSQGNISRFYSDPRDLAEIMGELASQAVNANHADFYPFGFPGFHPNFQMPWEGNKRALYQGIGISSMRYPRKELEEFARGAFIANMVEAMGHGDEASGTGATTVAEQTERTKNELAINELGPEDNQILEAILPVHRFSAYAPMVPSRIFKSDEVEDVWHANADRLTRLVEEWEFDAAHSATGENGLIPTVTAALEKKTDDLLTTYGADLAPRFLDALTGYFKSVKGEMVAENKTAAGVIANRQTSIQGQRQKCADATKKLFGKKEAIEKALRDYRFMLGELAKANGERIRTAQAIEFCTSMGATLADASRGLGRREGMLEIKSSCALQDAKREIDRSEPYEFLVKPDLDALPLSAPNPTEFFAWYREKTGKSSTEFWGVDMKEAWESINAYVATVEVSPALSTMTLASLLAQKSDAERKDLLHRVNQMSSPLLAVQPGKVAGQRTERAAASFVMIAAPKELMDMSPGIDELLDVRGEADVHHSDTPDEDTAYVLRSWGCIPAYALAEFGLLRNEYLEMAANPEMWSPHLDRRWSNVLPDLDPSGGKEAELYVWALAVSDIDYLQQIKKSRNFYAFALEEKLSSGKVVTHDVTLGSDLSTARAAFYVNKDCVHQCKQQIDSAITQQGNMKALQDLQAYLERLEAELLTADGTRKTLLMQDCVAVAAYVKSLA